MPQRLIELLNGRKPLSFNSYGAPCRKYVRVVKNHFDTVYIRLSVSANPWNMCISEGIKVLRIISKKNPVNSTI